MKLIAAAVFCALATCSAQELTSGPAPEDVQKVVEKMKSQGGWHAEFYISHNRRVSALYVPKGSGSNKPPRLSFWVRPLPETRNHNLQVMWDIGKTGKVNEAFAGTKRGKWFVRGIRGGEFQEEWQALYKEVVEEILKLPDQ